MTRPESIIIGHGGAATLLSGGRLQLQQGPINLVIKAYGPEAAVQAAYQAAIAYFPSILSGLVPNLHILKSPVTGNETAEASVAGNRMIKIASSFSECFVTPMASVAGAVADEILSILVKTPELDKIFVNNGGDIAIYLAGAEKIDIGVVPSLRLAVPEAKLELCAADGIGGVATSGWDGHSHSLGIADAVTVLAEDAATADMAATLIANKVDTQCNAIGRTPACELDDTSDLGGRMVTTNVGKLSETNIKAALQNGLDYANFLIKANRIKAVLIALQGSWAVAGSKFHPQSLGILPRV